MQILVVDDSKAMRMIVMRTLKQAGLVGHRTLEASNGEEAWGMIAVHSPDIVLCDWNMPVMNGYELLLKVQNGGKKCLFGFVTSVSGTAEREKALSAGAAFVITKPFTPQAFECALTPFLTHA